MPSRRNSKQRLVPTGLALRLVATFGSLVGMLVIIVIAINTYAQTQLVRQRLNERVEHFIKISTEVSLRFVIEGKPAELEVIFDDLARQRDLERIFIIDPEGYIFADSSDDKLFLLEVNDRLAKITELDGETHEIIDGMIKKVAFPLTLGGTNYGVIRLDIRQDIAKGEITAVLVRNLVVGIILIFAGSIIVWTASRQITRPLNLLTSASEQAAAGNLDQKIDVSSNDEIGSLANSFNTMLARLQASMNRVKEIAYRDKITGLPNRAWISEKLEVLGAESRKSGTKFAVLFLDIDRFKEVNDIHGHHTGDLLLEQFAERLLLSLKSCDLDYQDIEMSLDKNFRFFARKALLARLGGDEFTIIVDPRLAKNLASSIVETISKPFLVAERRISVTTSIGVAISPEHADNINDLLKCADTAMYQAKNAGRNRWAIFDTEHHRRELELRQLTSDLKAAVERDEFVVYLQPQFDVATGNLTGAEALLRWQHPKTGIVTPDNFIPQAKDLGLMPAIGRSVFVQAIRAAQHISRNTGGPFTLAINMSVVELVDQAFVEEFVEFLKFANLPSKAIEVEITEDAAMEIGTDIDNHISILRQAGVRLAVDDFGVGYSNLVRLRDMAFDTLKIDRSLTTGIGEIQDADNLMIAILDMAKSMQVDVVAEGIETAQQLEFLKKNGCRYYQGYFGGKPVSVSDFLDLMQIQAIPTSAAH